MTEKLLKGIESTETIPKDLPNLVASKLEDIVPGEWNEGNPFVLNISDSALKTLNLQYYTGEINYKLVIYKSLKIIRIVYSKTFETQDTFLGDPNDNQVIEFEFHKNDQNVWTQDSNKDDYELLKILGLLNQIDK